LQIELIAAICPEADYNIQPRAAYYQVKIRIPGTFVKFKGLEFIFDGKSDFDVLRPC
jgi:hypothetical protein